MTRFYKLSGGGNDFIALAEPQQRPPAAQIVAWCRRGTSEGADGVFLLHRTAQGVRMRHFNSDGGGAALCMNGTRCAARLAFELGWAKGATTVETEAGAFAATATAADEIELELPAPTAAMKRLEISQDETSWSGWLMEVGVPHLVLIWDRPMSEAPVETAGRALRRHPSLGPEGANVDFVSFPTPRAMEIRSFERGVEAETLACGTGVLAATAVALAEGLADLPLDALTKGGFRITTSAAERKGHWLMRGDARLLAEGTLRDGAEVLPEPPGW